MKTCLLILCCFLAVPLARAETVIEMSVLPGLKFSLKAFTVRPSSPVRIEFRNTDTMQHNLLITSPGKLQDVIQQALALGADGLNKGFVPDSPDVLHAAPMIAMNEAATLSFTAPEKEGDYPFVCTFPGHGFVMNGIMHVSHDRALKLEKNTMAQAKFSVPKPVDQPYLIRTWLPDASPAAIAVWLLNDQKICWDAGTCRLRFAWREGGFVDFKRHVESNGKPVPVFHGRVWYRGTVEHPLRFGDMSKPGKREYRGYRLVKGWPEFHYTINEVDVRVLYRGIPDAPGFTAHYRFEVPRPVHFFVPPEFKSCVKVSPYDGRQMTVTYREASP